MTSFISKCIIALMVLAALCTKADAQLILNRQVVGTNGGSGNLQQVLIQYTIGEPVVLPHYRRAVAADTGVSAAL
ncbi:hypothetical protein [Chitinophaga sp.]|uniref:hypothetical protein n=1 Tax=Chitinophaga sp. TaxID=1869181 RepID=UPI0031E02AD0